MGTWNEKIKGNDTTLDIYEAFFDKYNSGENPNSIIEAIKTEFVEYFNDPDDRTNALIGLALAEWETKSLEPELLSTLDKMINNGDDLKVWKKLGANEKSLIKRKRELEKFLEQISKEREKPKRRVRPKFKFSTTEIVRAISPDRNKELIIQDEFTNGNYIHTSGIIKWYSGGGSGIIYHNKPNCELKASWLNSQTIEIIHEPELNFSKKDSSAFYSGDKIEIIYKEK